MCPSQGCHVCVCVHACGGTYIKYNPDLCSVCALIKQLRRAEYFRILFFFFFLSPVQNYWTFRGERLVVILQQVKLTLFSELTFSEMHSVTILLVRPVHQLVNANI